MKKIIIFFCVALAIKTYALSYDLAHIYSIPKSGTHYLKSIISELTSTPCEQLKYTSPERIKKVHVFEHFHQRPNGHFSISKKTAFSSTKNHKKIILIRNLRDVLLSEMRMCDNAPVRIRWHFDKTCAVKPKPKKWRSLKPSHKARYVLLNSVINQDIKLSLKTIETNKNCLVVRFEHLLPKEFGGNDQVASRTVAKIKKFLKIKNTIPPLQILKMAWGKGATYISGKKVNELPPEVEEQFIKSKWYYLNKQLGYK